MSVLEQGTDKETRQGKPCHLLSFYQASIYENLASKTWPLLWATVSSKSVNNFLRASRGVCMSKNRFVKTVVTQVNLFAVYSFNPETAVSQLNVQLVSCPPGKYQQLAKLTSFWKPRCTSYAIFNKIAILKKHLCVSCILLIFSTHVLQPGFRTSGKQMIKNFVVSRLFQLYLCRQ